MSGALASLNYLFRQAWKNRSRLVTPSALGQPSVSPPVFQKLCGAAQDDLAKAVGALGEGAMTTVIDILERHHPEQYSSGPGDKVPRRCLPHRKIDDSESHHAGWVGKPRGFRSAAAGPTSPATATAGPLAVRVAHSKRAGRSSEVLCGPQGASAPLLDVRSRQSRHPLAARSTAEMLSCNAADFAQSQTNYLQSPGISCVSPVHAGKRQGGLHVLHSL